MVKIIVVLIALNSSGVLADQVLKDPTRPHQMPAEVSVTSVKSADFSVTSILKRRNVAWAIVNGKKANRGDHVDGAKILQITYDKVLLDIGDSQRWVPLSNNSGLKKSR